MSRRNYVFTQEKLKKLVKEGWGQGEGENYKPFLDPLKVSSHGFSPRRPGYKVKRIMEFLSRKELMYYFMLEHSGHVIDIREQYPLLDEDQEGRICASIEEVKTIANAIGVKYPKPQGKEIHIMTTDFLITTINEEGKKILVARTVKPIERLNKRVLEKFEIERIYWMRRGVDFKIVTEEQLNTILFRNLEFFYKQKEGVLEYIEWNVIVKGSRFFEKYLLEQETNIIQSGIHMIEALREEEGIQKEIGLVILKFLVANKFWKVDLINKELKKLEDIEVMHIDMLPEEEGGC